MSTDSKLYQTLLLMRGKLLMLDPKADTTQCDEALTAHEAEQAGDTLTAAYMAGAHDARRQLRAEQEQAGEAVVVVYSISGQSQTEDAYATVQILNSAGKAYWDLPVKAGTKLYTRPQQPLSDEQVAAGRHEWLYSPAVPNSSAFVCGARFAERAHGITKEPKT